MSINNKLTIGAGFYSPDQLKVFQIKEIINIINKDPKTTEEKKIKGYSNKNKADLLKLLVDTYKIKTINYDVKESYEKIPADPRSKYGIKKNDKENQIKYLQELNENKKYENPLKPLKPYTTKEGNFEDIKLEPHQINFIKEFIFSNLRGAIAFHGVGSGKTLTAVVASYYYLKIYPTKKVIVISPSALLYNFINGMIQYGLDISDNRYYFITYDKYIREVQKGNKDLLGDDSLIIIDEAHNFRTQIIKHNEYDENGELEGTKATTNLRGDKIMRYGTNKAHKVLLLTGTAFVNKLYDIENLLAMIEGREPINLVSFEQLIGQSIEEYQDYFNYRISLFKTSPDSIYFPKKILHLESFEMDKTQEKEYERLKREGRERPEEIVSGKPNMFYSAERYASNYNLGKQPNPKLEWIIKQIKLKKNEKFIIYSGLFDSGISKLEKELKKEGIKSALITGAQSVSQKENSKKLFNGYNFGREDFFTKEQKDAKTFIENNETRVLLITRAGAEGVDTINTENIILLDQTWNDALADQIIARAIRFKSHIGLKKIRDDPRGIVNVYRLFLIRKSNKKAFKDIKKAVKEDNNEAFISYNKEISNAKKIELELFQKDNGTYEPTIELLKSLKAPTYMNGKKIGEELFIPKKTEYYNQKGSFGKKSTVEIKGGQEGWDIYEEIKDDNKKNLLQKRKIWKIKAYASWYANNAPEYETQNDHILGNFQNLTVDLQMFILSKSKTANIERFISSIGTTPGKIQVFENYMKMNLLEEVKKIETKINNSQEILKLTKEMNKTQDINEKNKKLDEINDIIDRYQAKMYGEILNKSVIKILKSKYKPDIPETGKAREVELQQYFTNLILAKKLLDKTSLTNNTQSIIKVLEPTAGDGALITPVLLTKKPLNIDLVEYDPKNREKLNKLVKRVHQIEIQKQVNFLKLIKGAEYDYIFTNPPFHLKTATDANLLGKVWDIDFIERAFSMLKVGGEMVAITGKNWTFSNENKELRKFFTGKEDVIRENNNFSNEILTIEWEFKEDKFMDNSKGQNKVIKVNIVILHIIKNSSSEDNRIINKTFYKTDIKDKEKGKNILLNIEPIPIINRKEDKKLIVKNPIEEPQKVEQQKEVPKEYARYNFKNTGNKISINSSKNVSMDYIILAEDDKKWYYTNNEDDSDPLKKVEINIKWVLSIGKKDRKISIVDGFSIAETYRGRQTPFLTITLDKEGNTREYDFKDWKKGIIETFIEYIIKPVKSVKQETGRRNIIL